MKIVTAAVLSGCLACVVLAATPGLAQHDVKSESLSLPILVIVEPGDPGLENPVPPPEGEELKILQGAAVRIRGVTAPGLSGKPLRITVTPPQAPEQPDPTEAPDDISDGATELVSSGSSQPHPPTTVTLNAAGGTFATIYVTKVAGGHEVEVVDSTGQHRGTASFEVESATEFGKALKEQLEKEAEELLKNARAMVKAMAPRIRELPASPARDEATEMAKKLEETVARHEANNRPAEWVGRLDHLARLQRMGPGIQAATQPLLAQLGAWKEQASRANSSAPAELASLTRGNILCDQLDVIVNGLKLVDFYLGLFTKPGQYMIDWAKENVPTKLAQQLPWVKPTKAATDALENSWKGVLGGRAIGKDVNKGDISFESSATVQKLVNGMAGFMASRVFDRYCQTFQGPVSGSMVAVFYNDKGEAWWRYRTEIKGELILRYPKDAKGEQIALTGEFLGNAVKFKSSDNAIPVLYPGLAAGTIFKEIYRREPLSLSSLPVLYSSPATAPSLPNPIMDSIEKGGPAVQNILTPAFFRVPVRGDLRGDTVRIELQTAATDFDDARAVVRMLILPVLSMRIQVEDYALPYKGARFLLFRAMHDGPAEFKVHRAGKAMYIDHKLSRERKADKTKGTYDVSIKACNPACAPGGPSVPPAQM